MLKNKSEGSPFAPQALACRTQGNVPPPATWMASHQRGLRSWQARLGDPAKTEETGQEIEVVTVVYVGECCTLPLKAGLFHLHAR
jgi:hypothetical protein